MPAWLVILSWVSVLTGLGTAAVIAADVKAHPQGMGIMNIVWPVTGLYTPVFGYVLYRALGRPMARDAPETSRPKPFWKSIFLSATHCGSGCVLGDVIGAPIVLAAGWTLFGQRLFADYVAEGFCTTYPANALLVRAGIKGGM